ncbi:hypothetical protein [Natronospora cellulosivora (SeqCode)]
MKKTIITVLTFVLLATPILASGGINFLDAPAPEFWVYENFQILNNAGILRGYPDITFKGHESASRYEMVMMTARIFQTLEEKIESEIQANNKEYLNEEEIKELIAASIDDSDDLDKVYQALQELEREFSQELEIYNLRITTLEDNFNNLKIRINDLEDINQKQSEKIDELSNDLRTSRMISYIAIALGISSLLF